MRLPSDDNILLSLINTKLRDRYPSLSDLCAEEEADEEEICSRLGSLGYTYDEKLNKFVYF